MYVFGGGINLCTVPNLNGNTDRARLNSATILCGPGESGMGLLLKEMEVPRTSCAGSA